MRETYDIFYDLQEHADKPEFKVKKRNEVELAQIKAEGTKAMSTHVRTHLTKAEMLHNYKLFKLRLEVAIYQRQTLRAVMLHENIDADIEEKQIYDKKDKSVHETRVGIEGTDHIRDAAEDKQREDLSLEQLEDRVVKRKLVRLEGYLRYVS